MKRITTLLFLGLFAWAAFLVTVAFWRENPLAGWTVVPQVEAQTGSPTPTATPTPYATCNPNFTCGTRPVGGTTPVTFYSDGSEDSVQCLTNIAQNGDIINIPAGEYHWTCQYLCTKAITLQGQTVVSNAGLAPCKVNGQPNPHPVVPCASADDATGSGHGTVIYDDKPRRDPTNVGPIFKIIVPSGAPPAGRFRMTGITVRKSFASACQNNCGVSSSPPPTPACCQGQDAFLNINSSDSTSPVTDVRVYNCHFDTLEWERPFTLDGWIFGVFDHNLWDGGHNAPALDIHHGNWGGSAQNTSTGHGSFADCPYYGSEKFWFIEDNTFVGIGGVSGGIDCSNGGRFVYRHNFGYASGPNGHGTDGWPGRGMRANEVYENNFDLPTGWVETIRSGSSIWHDNFEQIYNYSGSPNIAALVCYRQINGYSSGIMPGDNNGYGLADGTNGWDYNCTGPGLAGGVGVPSVPDPRCNGAGSDGTFFSGTAQSASSVVNGAGQVTVNGALPTLPNGQSWLGKMLRNDHAGPPAATSYLWCSVITAQNGSTLTYLYQISEGPGVSPNKGLKFSAGDELSIRAILQSFDSPGVGKGNLIVTCSQSGCNNTRSWVQQQVEQCLSWNNYNNQKPAAAPGFGNGGNPNMDAAGYSLLQNFGYTNGNPDPGARPAPTVIAQAGTIYNQQVNSCGSPVPGAYTHEYQYPHPLVVPVTPSPTPTATVTPTGTPAATPTATATVTATPTATMTATPTATPTASPSCTVPNPPSGLSATVISSTQINLAWTNNDSSQTQVTVERSTDGTIFRGIASLQPLAASYPDTGLTPSTLYYYRVHSNNSCGRSADSNVVSATTLGGNATPTATPTVTATATVTPTATAVATPPAPTGLSATLTACNAITLNWSYSGGTIDGFKLERSTDNLNFNQFALALPGDRSSAGTGFAQGQLWYFRIRAYQGTLNSLYSNTASVSTTVCPTPTATATSTPTPTPTPTVAPSSTPGGTPQSPQNFHSVKKTVTWTLNSPTDQVTSYRLYRKQGNSGGVLIGAVNGQTNVMDVSNATQGNRTTFWNTAVNARGESPQSNQVIIQK